MDFQESKLDSSNLLICHQVSSLLFVILILNSQQHTLAYFSQSLDFFDEFGAVDLLGRVLTQLTTPSFAA